ncbi:MAG: aspartate-semialdehyde dehydrogenase, partial [Porticoccus sp.]
MNKVGFVGWRGMVGSVLMDRMIQENDFADIEPIFFTTSQLGQPGPFLGEGLGKDVAPLQDANDIESLAKLDIIVTCQGGDYTKAVYP